jgi:hypothetical protein
MDRITIIIIVYAIIAIASFAAAFYIKKDSKYSGIKRRAILVGILSIAFVIYLCYKKNSIG